MQSTCGTAESTADSSELHADIGWWITQSAFEFVLKDIQDRLGCDPLEMYVPTVNQHNTDLEKETRLKLMANIRMLDQTYFEGFLEKLIPHQRQHSDLYPWEWTSVFGIALTGCLLAQDDPDIEHDECDGDGCVYATIPEILLAGMIIASSKLVANNSLSPSKAIGDLEFGIKQLVARWIGSNSTNNEYIMNQLWTRILKRFGAEAQKDDHFSLLEIATLYQHLFTLKSSTVCSCHSLLALINANTGVVHSNQKSKETKADRLEDAIFASYLSFIGIKEGNFNLFDRSPSDNVDTEGNKKKLSVVKSAVFDTLHQFARQVGKYETNVIWPRNEEIPCENWCIQSRIVAENEHSGRDSPPQTELRTIIIPQDTSRPLKTMEQDIFVTESNDPPMQKKQGNELGSSIKNMPKVDMVDISGAVTSSIRLLPVIADESTKVKRHVEQTDQMPFGPGTSIRPLLAPLQHTVHNNNSSTNSDKQNSENETRLLDELNSVSPRRLAPMPPVSNKHTNIHATTPKQRSIEADRTPARLPSMSNAKMDRKGSAKSLTEINSRSPTTAATGGLTFADLLKQLPDETKPRRGSGGDTDQLSDVNPNDLDIDPDAEKFIEQELSRVAENLPPSPILGGEVQDQMGTLLKPAKQQTSRPLDTALLASVPVAPELAWKQRSGAKSGTASGSISIGDGKSDYRENSERIQAVRAMAKEAGIKIEALPEQNSNNEADMVEDLNVEDFIYTHHYEKESSTKDFDDSLYNAPRVDLVSNSEMKEPSNDLCNPAEAIDNVMGVTMKPADGNIQAELAMLGLDEIEDQDDEPNADAESLGSSFDEPDAPVSMILSDSEETDYDEPSESETESDTTPSEDVDDAEEARSGSYYGYKEESGSEHGSSHKDGSNKVADAMERVEIRKRQKMRRNSQVGIINGVVLGTQTEVVGVQIFNEKANKTGVKEDVQRETSIPVKVRDLRVQVRSSIDENKADNGTVQSITSQVTPPEHMDDVNINKVHTISDKRTLEVHVSATTPSPLPNFRPAPFTFGSSNSQERGSPTIQSYSWDPARRLEWEDDEDAENSSARTAATDNESSEGNEIHETFLGLPGEVAMPSTSRRKASKPKADEFGGSGKKGSITGSSQASRKAALKQRRDDVESRLTHSLNATDDSDNLHESDIVKAALDLAASGKLIPNAQKTKPSITNKYRQIAKGGMSNEVTTEHHADVNTALPAGHNSTPGRSGMVYSKRGSTEKSTAGNTNSSLERASEIGFKDDELNVTESPMTRARNVASRFEEACDASDFDISDCVGNGMGGSSIAAVESLNARGDDAWADPVDSKKAEEEGSCSCGGKSSCSIA